LAEASNGGCANEDNREWQGFCGGTNACPTHDNGVEYDAAFQDFEDGVKPSCGTTVCTLLSDIRWESGIICDYQSDMSKGDKTPCNPAETTCGSMECFGDECCHTTNCNYLTMAGYENACNGSAAYAIIVGIMVMINDMFLRMLAECGWAQGERASEASEL